MKCDVLVVGAGPAGCSAAAACGAAGLKTIVVERKPEIGVPITCSGAIGSYLLPYLPFKTPKNLLKHSIEGLEFIVDEVSYVRRGGPWSSYAIDRSAFDKWLSQRAVDSGADLIMSAEFIDATLDKSWSGGRAQIRKKDEIIEVDFKVMIGADGARSRVLETLGERVSDARMGQAVVYEYEGVTLESPELDQLYFGDFAPGGYAHIFPLSDNRANIGVGTIASDADLRQCFQDFVALPRVKAQLKDGRPVLEKSGTVSFEPLSLRRQYGSVLLAGEAASQNIKPLVEGFLPAIICGDVAGKTAARHLLNGESLSRYQRNLDRRLGLILRESDRLISLLEDISDLSGRKSYLLLSGLCGNLISPREVSKLALGDEEDITSRLESWNKSRLKQFLSNASERLAIIYLHAQAAVNNKIYKL
ncbi:hypothetical protein BMS3Abin16_01510 [archaeon BMS3Abin16]|nr:hypothetical protein BMS3Abin16_01510 [archaeon BMS3Abin16]